MCLKAHKWQNEALLRKHTQELERVKMRRQPLFSAYLSLTYTNTYIAAEQTSTFTACAFMCVCVLHVWRIENRGRVFKPNVFSVILMTHSQINLELSVSSLTSQLGT